MILFRVLHAETLKLKRTIALKMVVVAPLAVVVLIIFGASQAPFSIVRRGDAGNEWMGLARINLVVWAILMLPLLITLETALVAGLDHAENQWKNLLARPVPRWTFYVAKLLIVTAMIGASTAVLLFGVLVAGAVLPMIQPELHFAHAVPWTTIFRQGTQVAGLAFLALAIQHWVSLRWRAFSVAVGTGIVAMVASYLFVMMSRQTGGWLQYFPWALPMLVHAPNPHEIGRLLLMSWAAGLTVSGAGCWDFCGREVS